MSIHLAAAAANCSTGTWVQQFKCGYNQPVSPHVTSFAHSVGYGLIPALIVIGLVVFVVRSVRNVGKAMRRKTSRSTAPAGARR
jgi:hypothetical protein